MEPELIHRFACLNGKLHVITFSSAPDEGFCLIMNAVDAHLDDDRQTGKLSKDFMYVTDGWNDYQSAFGDVCRLVTRMGGSMVDITSVSLFE